MEVKIPMFRRNIEKLVLDEINVTEWHYFVEYEHKPCGHKWEESIDRKGTEVTCPNCKKIIKLTWQT